MTDKSNFTPDEWKLILESVMMAGIAVSAAEPSGLWGLLKESFASGTALVTAKMDPGSNPLIKAVVADFESADGRSIARDGVKEQLTGSTAGEIKANASRRYGRLARWSTPRRLAMRQPSRAGCTRSANTLPKQPRRVDFSALVACR